LIEAVCWKNANNFYGWFTPSLSSDKTTGANPSRRRFLIGGDVDLFWIVPVMGSGNNR
jgi:hypothetical protein